MTVSVQTPYNTYSGNGSTTVYPYTFLLLDEVDIEVYVDGVLIPVGQYSVSDVANDNGGNVTFNVAPASGSFIKLQRKVSLSRGTDYTQGGSLAADVLDYDIDRTVQMIQDVVSTTVTIDGADNIDALGKRIVNVGTAEDDNDVATKIYVETSMTSQVNQAAGSAAAAASSANSAANSASSAAVSEANSSASETAAALSESNASTSEANAANSESNAAASAAAVLTSETNAAASETAAEQYATNSAISAGNAANSEANAAISEGNAAASEAAAANSEANAANSESISAANEASSKTSELTALVYKNEAAASAAAASTSESNAAISETNAANSAASASASEANAASIESNVITSELNASASAAAAALSEGDAAASAILAQQAAQSVAGGMSFFGSWDASAGAPPTPSEGTPFYKITVAGTINSVSYGVGDNIVWDGAAWFKIDNTDAVTTVNGQSGVVNLTKSDVGLSNVDNTSDVNKPISNAVQSALNGKLNSEAKAADSDLLDGYNLSEPNVGNTVVRRSSSGDIKARLFRSEYDSTNSSINYIMTQIDTADNNYIRPSTPSQFRSAVTDGHYLASGGNAVTASRWQSSRTISVGGECNGSASFNGSSNFTLNVNLDDTGWIIPSMLNGAIAADTSAAPVRYRKLGHHMVHVEGLVDISNSGNGTAAFRLNSVYRPGKDIKVRCPAAVFVVGGGMCQIRPDGYVLLWDFNDEWFIHINATFFRA